MKFFPGGKPGHLLERLRVNRRQIIICLRGQQFLGPCLESELGGPVWLNVASENLHNKIDNEELFFSFN